MASTSSAPLKLGDSAPAFALTDTRNDSQVSLADHAGRPLLVMFWCNHCPYVKHVADHVAGFAREFADRLAVVAISANDPKKYPADAPARMKEEAERRGFVFPYLFDATQDIAKSYDARTTPDFYLFTSEHNLAYHGRYDSSRPGHGQPTGDDLRAAVEAMLGGQSPSPDQANSIGCSIKWRPGNAPA